MIVTHNLLSILLDARFDADLRILEPLFRLYRHSLLLAWHYGDFDEICVGLGHRCFIELGDGVDEDALPRQGEETFELRYDGALKYCNYIQTAQMNTYTPLKPKSYTNTWLPR
jgi:hypothetical protein